MKNDHTETSRPAWQLVAGRISRFFGIQFYDLYLGRRDLSTPSEPVAPSLSTDVRLATTGDLDEIASGLGGETRKKIDRNIALGSTCYAAVHEGSITGYMWVNEEIVELLGMYVTVLPASHSFIHDAFVFPEYRGMKIYQYLLQVACGEMHKTGCLSIACLVDRANVRAIGAFSNEGFEFRSAPVLKLPGVNPILLRRALA